MDKTILKNISTSISSGLTPLRSDVKFWKNGDIPWLKTEQLGVRYIYDTNEKITNSALSNTSIKVNPKNTLSIAMYGEGRTRGNVSILKNEMTTNQACCNVVINETKADYKFVYYFLKMRYHQLRNLSSGVRKNLNSNDIKNFEIVLPKSILEQKKIVSILSFLDSKIELNNKINAELESMAKTIFNYWFVQFDFPDENGKPYKSSGGKMVWNDKIKREVPEGWDVSVLRKVAKIILGQSPKGDSYNQEKNGTPLLNGPADYENGLLLPKVYTTEPTRFCQKDDLVFCIRATIGKLTFSEDSFCLGRGVAAVRPNNSYLLELTYFHILQEIERFKKQATGSIIKGIIKEDIVDSLFILPPINVTLEFHKFVSPLFIKSRHINFENHNLSELRDFLLPMLMNGQVKVK